MKVLAGLLAYNGLLVVALKFNKLHAEDVVYGDPRLEIFKSADYSSLATIHSLGYMLDSANSRSVIINKRYKSLNGCHMNRPMFHQLLHYLSIYLADEKINERTVRKFFDMRTLTQVKGLDKYLSIKGLARFLSFAVPLSGTVDSWMRMPNVFIKALLERAADDPDAKVEFRGANPSIMPFSLSDFLDNPQSFIFTLDYTTIGSVEKHVAEKIIPNIFSAPADYDDVLKSLVYMIHFVTCVTAYRVVNYKPMRINVGAGGEMKVLLQELTVNQTSNLDKVAKRIKGFLEVSVELELLCRSLVGAKTSNVPLSLKTSRIAEAIDQYTSGDHLCLNRTSRNRLNLNLIVLTFVEREFAERKHPVSMKNTQRIIRDTFRHPYEINIKDLIMAVIVVGEYSLYDNEARVVLDILFKFINETPKLALGILAAEDISSKVKLQISLKLRRRYLIRQLEWLPKTLLIPHEFLSHDAPKQRFLTGPWKRETYERFERRMSIATNPFASIFYIKEDAQFTRDFLAYFVPWLLKERFVYEKDSHRNIHVFYRAKLDLDAREVSITLANSLRTALLLDFTFHERFALGNGLIEHIQTFWNDYGGDYFSVEELGEILVSGKRVSQAENKMI